MLLHDIFTEEFASIASALRAENLVVLAQLHFIIVNRFSQVVRHAVAVFNIVQLLQTVDRDTENLSARLEH